MFKLFVATSAMIVLLFALVAVAEGLFFERFYKMSKLNELQQSAERFEREYGAGDRTEREEAKLLGEFMNRANASIAILDDEYGSLDINPYFIDMTVGANTVTLRIPAEGMKVGDIPKGLTVGERLVADGFFMDEKDTVMMPVVLSRPNAGGDHAGPEEGLSRVAGPISELLLPDRRAYNPYYQDELLKEALKETVASLYLVETEVSEGKTTQLEWIDKWTGLPYSILLMPIKGDHHEGRYIFALSSLQPVGEAVDVLKKYVFYLAPVIIAVALILSLLFSKMVAKPLVKLSRTAERMAKLDFTAGESINSKDEFGALSRNLNALSHNLDSTLRDLTFANQRLQEDVEEKKRLEELRRELIANISHELKTPLGIVKGFAEGLQDDVAHDKRERYLTFITSEIDRMNLLILDMLELSKYEAKAILLKPSEFSVKRLLEDTALAFTRELENKSLKIAWKADGDWLVWADMYRLEQVAVNLLSNAVRHAAEGSVIHVEIMRYRESKVRVRIENEGPPIAEADMERIWDQFYRAERSRDRKTGGTGLGLSIVKHILKLHGSEFGAENTRNGVSFYFTLEERGEEVDDEA
ncbi:sensor histidine kinase [Paenibacillus sp. M.A.Huq-81]